MVRSGGPKLDHLLLDVWGSQPQQRRCLRLPDLLSQGAQRGILEVHNGENRHRVSWRAIISHSAKVVGIRNRDVARL